MAAVEKGFDTDTKDFFPARMEEEKVSSSALLSPSSHTLRRRTLALALAVAAASLMVGVYPVSAVNTPSQRADIVVLKSSVEGNKEVPGHSVADIESKHKLENSVIRSYHTALQGFSAKLTPAQEAALAADPDVLRVVADKTIKVEETSPQLKKSSGQILPTGVNRVDADQSWTKAGNGNGTVDGVGVAVIDTGIDTSSGQLNVVDAVNCSSSTSSSQLDGHGTHVAGIIGAKDDKSAVVGVAPYVSQVDIRVFDENGSGTWDNVICGINAAMAEKQNKPGLNLKVANMSFAGGELTADPTQDPVIIAVENMAAAGILPVAASGNSSEDIATIDPARAPDALTVTSMANQDGLVDSTDTYSTFSDFATPGSGEASHTVAAPGEGIQSLWPGGGLATLSGTSMAAGHISGIAALDMAQNPNLSSAAEFSALLANAAAQPLGFGYNGDPHSPISGKYFGYLGRAVSAKTPYNK